MENGIVIGAGIMGTALARHFLKCGHRIALIDPDEAARAAAAARIGPSEEFITAPTPEALPAAWGSCHFVIEAVPERLDLKRQVLGALSRQFGPDTLIASNTSGLRAADLARDMTHPERFAIAHFFNPADLIPAVELVPAPATTPQTMDHWEALLTRSGKKVARLRADLPGFVANRLQHAMARECFHLLEAGVIDAEGLDTLTRYALGVRLALIGPILQRDLNGIDTHHAIARYLYPDLAANTTPAQVLDDKCAAGMLGRKTAQGFYTWDARQERRAQRVEALLPAVIALARQIETEENDDAEMGEQARGL